MLLVKPWGNRTHDNHKYQPDNDPGYEAVDTEWTSDRHPQSTGQTPADHR
jgi:hypothetical protein